MADNTKKTSDNNRILIEKSESNAALSGRIKLGRENISMEDKKYSIEVRNAMPAPPNPNKGKG